jgi:purine-nucleoside/S-methyl-5'-thioadenosine phosphorylase / adenosine deaminase
LQSGRIGSVHQARKHDMPNVRSIQRQPAKIPAPAIIDDGWALRSISGLEIVTSEIFDSVPWLLHGFSTRKAGASRLDGAAALNLGFTDWDSRKTVERNRNALVRAIVATKLAAKTKASCAKAQRLVTLRQIHSDIVRAFSKAPVKVPQADAAISLRAGLLLAVQTADCVPILLADTRRHAVAAVHAGWRGTLARIVMKTLGRMRAEFGTKPGDVIAALGPAIGPCCYEVGPEVALAFSGQFAQAREWFEGPFDRLATGEEPNPLPWLTMMPPGHEPPPERVRLDLRAANRWQLVNAGVRLRNIAVSTLCTGCRSNLFFSYRKEGAKTGRMMGVIGIGANSS